jgi:hypothetical protein
MAAPEAVAALAEQARQATNLMFPFRIIRIAVMALVVVLAATVESAAKLVPLQ